MAGSIFNRFCKCHNLRTRYVYRIPSNLFRVSVQGSIKVEIFPKSFQPDKYRVVPCPLLELNPALQSTLLPTNVALNVESREAPPLIKVHALELSSISQYLTHVSGSSEVVPS